MATMTPTLPGEYVMSGCAECNPALVSNAGGRIHEGHFSVGLGDQRMQVYVDGEKALGVREVIIDRETLLAQVWVYPRPYGRCCECGQGALIEVWHDVPGVTVMGKR